VSERAIPILRVEDAERAVASRDADGNRLRIGTARG
jgi:hypothetical protein